MNLTLITNENLEDRIITLTAKDDLPIFIQRLTESYINPEAGLQMHLPQGWIGFQSRGALDFAIVDPNIVNVTDIDKQNVSMAFQ